MTFQLHNHSAVAGTGKTIQQQILYLGEINNRQRVAWQKTIELFEDGSERPRQVALFAEDREEIISDEKVVRIRLKDMQLHTPPAVGRVLAGHPSLRLAGVE